MIRSAPVGRKPLPEVKYLMESVDYAPDTGLFTWKQRPLHHFASEAHHQRWNKRFAGRPAFSIDSGAGYKLGVLAGVRGLAAHRIAFKYVHGTEPQEVDHINGNRSDNRISNLRAVSVLENRRNAARPRTNSSGSVGVHFKKDKQRWVAFVTVANRYRHLGYFDTKEEAIERRSRAERELGFHPNHGRALCQ